MTSGTMGQTEHEIDLKAGRRRVARSRGALSGALIVLLGLWAALAPFIGPYLDFGLAPKPDDAWHWTGGRGLYEVLPGGVAVLAGLLLLVSTSRALTITVAWLAAAAGAWLVVGPQLSDVFNVSAGGPDPKLGERGRAAEALLYFYAIGGAILFLAGTAVGRLSVHSVRDVKAAERRAEADAAAAAEEQRLEEQRRANALAEHDEHQRRRDEEQARAETGVHRDTAVLPDTGRHVDDAGRHTDARAAETAEFRRPSADDPNHYGTHHTDQPAYTQPEQQPEQQPRTDVPGEPPPPR